MKKLLLVLLIVVAILGSIRVYLWANDIIYFSGKDVAAILIIDKTLRKHFLYYMNIFIKIPHPSHPQI